MDKNTSLLSNTQKSIRGMSSQTLVTLLTGVVDVGSFAILSRLLSKQDFGHYAVILAVTTIFYSLAEAGIGSAIVQKKDLDKSYINSAFTLSLIFGGAMSICLFFGANTISGIIGDIEVAVPLMIMSVTLLINSVVSVNISLMQRNLAFLKIGVVTLSALIITSAIAILLAYWGFGFYAIVTRAVLSSILTLILSFIFVHPNYRIALAIDKLKEIFNFSGWLTASVIIRNLSQQIDRLMMSSLTTAEVLGAYNRPKEFVTQISTKLNNIFDTALFPILSSIQDSPQSLINAFKKSFFYLNLLGMIVLLALLVNSEFIIRVFFGEDWLNLNIVFMILSGYFLLNVDGRLFDCYLRSLALTKQQYYFRIFQLLITVLGIWLVAKMGIIAIATMVILTNLIIVLAKMIYICRKIHYGIKDALLEQIRSWRFLLILLPECVAFKLLWAGSIVGNILTVILFSISIAILFLCFPKLIGKEYADSAYPTIINKLKSIRK